jgi:hypothetical protein
MQEIRNGNGKFVCRADGNEKIVEIIVKGQRTIIKFMPNGTMQVSHTTI